MLLLHLNLLPWREQQRQQVSKIFLRSLWFGIGIIVSLTVLVNVNLYLQLEQQRLRNHYLQNQIKMLRAPLVKLERILQKRKTILAHLQALANLHIQGLHQLELINTIATILPTSAYLFTMESNMPFLIVSGQTRSQININTILMKLKRPPG